MRLALCAIALVMVLDVSLESQPPARGSMGQFPLPVELPTTGESCNARVLATGPVDSAAHEAEEGFAQIGGVSLSARPASIPALVLREQRGQRVDLLLRILEPRALKEIRR